MVIIRPTTSPFEGSPFTDAKRITNADSLNPIPAKDIGIRVINAVVGIKRKKKIKGISKEKDFAKIIVLIQAIFTKKREIIKVNKKLLKFVCADILSMTSFTKWIVLFTSLNFIFTLFRRFLTAFCVILFMAINVNRKTRTDITATLLKT
jgi:hypothetical protein